MDKASLEYPVKPGLVVGHDVEIEDVSEALESNAHRIAEALDHPNTLAHALHNFSISLQIAGDRDGAFAAGSRAAALAQKFGLLPWRAGSLLLTAWASAVGAGIADAARLVDAEIASATASGPLPQYFIGLAAEVLLGAGRAADALAHLDRAIAGIDEPGVGFYVPEIYRLRGECLLARGRGNKDEAEQAFKQAIDDFNTAIKMNPGFYQAFANRALVERGMQKDDLAFADYNQAIQINGNYAVAYVGRGNMYRERKQLDAGGDHLPPPHDLGVHALVRAHRAPPFNSTAASSTSAIEISSSSSSDCALIRSPGSWLRSVPSARHVHGRPAASNEFASEAPPERIGRGS